MKLIANWQDIWRLWSVRIAAIGALVQAILLGAPDAALTAWGALPDELRALLPEGSGEWISLALFVAAIGARIVRQREASDGE